MTGTPPKQGQHHPPVGWMHAEACTAPRNVLLLKSDLPRTENRLQHLFGGNGVTSTDRRTSKRATDVEDVYVLLFFLSPSTRFLFSPLASVHWALSLGSVYGYGMSPGKPECQFTSNITTFRRNTRLTLQKTKCLQRDQSRNQCQACYTANMGCTFELPLTASRTKRIKRGLGEDPRIRDGEGGLGLLAAVLPEERGMEVRRPDSSTRKEGK